MDAPASGDDWVALTIRGLPIADAASWVARPRCGAIVVFAGTVRDHSEGRPGVSALDYEAYSEEVEPRLARLCADARRRWPALGRVVVWHRSGRMDVGEISVVVAVSAPHRADAFDAGRWAIDTLKATIPIWKRETWDAGADWGSGAEPISELGSLGEVSR